MHELPPMTHLQRGTVIDLHHNILPLTARSVPDAQALLDASVALPNSRLRTLSPQDMVIHSSVHLFHEGELKNGLRDLFDLHALITEFAATQDAFWPALLRRAEALGLVWPLHLALRWTRRLAGTPVPDDALCQAAEAARMGRARQAVLDAIYERAFRPDHPLLAQPDVALARWALYLRGHALRMPWPLLVRHLARKALMRTVMHTSRRGP
jgi:hypothetical protein